MIKTTEPFPPDAFTSTNDYLAMVASVDPAAYVELPSFGALSDGAAVEQDSRRWAGRFLRPSASPYRPAPEVKRAACHATRDHFDLLRHELRVGKTGLEIVESALFVLVRIRPEHPLALGGDDRPVAEAIEALLDELLVTKGRYDDLFGQPTPYGWVLFYEAPIRDGSRFTSNPRREPPMLRAYAERLDGGISDARPFFLGFKARASRDGRLVFLDGRHWFDGKCWAPYERLPRR